LNGLYTVHFTKIVVSTVLGRRVYWHLLFYCATKGDHIPQMKTLQNDLNSHRLSRTESVNLTQNWPLRRLLATSGTMHLQWCKPWLAVLCTPLINSSLTVRVTEFGKLSSIWGPTVWNDSKTSSLTIGSVHLQKLALCSLYMLVILFML